MVAAQASDTVKQVNSRTQNINLGLNKSIVIDLPKDAYDILVANPGVADAVSRTARRIYIFGKQVGNTNIFVFGPNGEQIASIDLTVERDVAGLDSYLARFIEDSDIKAEIINDNVVLTGTVQTPQDASRAVQLAEIFVTGGEATTGAFNSSAPAAAAGSVVIGGDQEERRTSKIVNLIKIVGDDQVTLKVTIAEVSRNVMKQLGMNVLASGSSSSGINFSGFTGTFAGLGKPLQDASDAVLQGNLGSFNLRSYLTAMEQSGVMKTLSEPTLTAVSGEKATFKVGGEFNLVTTANREVDKDTGELKYSYQVTKIDYGIGLEFTPVVLSPGRISLKVRTSVSEPTNEGSVSMAGSNLISIRKRLADTTIELPSGGSMMIAGLVRDDSRQVINGYPGAKNIPVLGALFRSRDFVRNETELVIIVTPYLVRPVARNKLAKPDDNFNVASDGAGYLLGRVNRVYGTTQTKRPNGRYHGVVGFIYK
ncbi:MAG: type II and III secretion system protein family protein [Rhizobiaceae bacterium]